MIDAKTIEELQGLLAKATKGSWKFVPWHIEEANAAVRAPTGWLICSTSSDADSELIAEMRNALPALLDLASKAPATLSLAGEGEKREREDAERERDRLRDVIERDRTKTAEIIGGIRAVVGRWSWLGEGRGSYAWDDDRYQDEFRQMLDALKEATDPLRALAADWTDCPQDYQAARIDWKARAEAAARIRSLSAENERLKTMLTGGNLEIVESEQAWKLRAESSEALVAELLEKVERLTKALEPFKDAANQFREDDSDDRIFEIVAASSSSAGPFIELGELRRARSELEGR